MRSRSARSRELRANALAGTAASPRLLPRTPARSSYRGIRLPREAQIVASPLLCYIGNANPPPEVNVNRWKASRKKTENHCRLRGAMAVRFCDAVCDVTPLITPGFPPFPEDLCRFLTTA